TAPDINIRNLGFCIYADGDNVPEMNLPCQEVTIEMPPATTCAATRSRHAGGVNVLRGDASVSFVSSTISATVFKAMGTIANGDSIQ
ncbi:MAG: DUF1559 domain-containing protein, partial [Fibrobacter sp.]|nr:DUF1559 domain-containing protein [Fibrobacter sp.]